MGATALQLQCTAVQGRGQTTKLQCGSLELGKRALGVSALVSAPQCMWPYTLAHSGCGPGIGPTLSSGGGACESGRDTGTIGIKPSSFLALALPRPAFPLLLTHFAFFSSFQYLSTNRIGFPQLPTGIYPGSPM